MPSCASMVLDLRWPGVAAASSSRGEQERQGRALRGRGGRRPVAPPRLAPGGPQFGSEGRDLGQVGLGGASASVPSLPWLEEPGSWLLLESLVWDCRGGCVHYLCRGESLDAARDVLDRQRRRRGLFLGVVVVVLLCSGVWFRPWASLRGVRR
jgi:hypothetical protein